MPKATLKQEILRELARSKLYALPDSAYRTAMLEACAAYDEWNEADKRPGRFGRKYPQQKAAPKRRKKAA